MPIRKSIEFLPEIFRTDTNKKFLNATVDQLISEPQFKRITGYIGRKLAPSFKTTDSYIAEPSASRQNYQLEPSLIIKDTISDKITFATTYYDIVNQIGHYGGLNNKHDRLFDNEYYTYDPKLDFDKFINFSQYYWLENGPSAVIVSAGGVPLSYEFTVTYDSVNKVYLFSGQGSAPNPTLTLARGGVYTFVNNNQDNPFYIQSKTGTSGFDPASPNINVREVLGVSNNGAEVGTIQFTIPSETAQIQWTSMTVAATVDYATDLSYANVHGATLDDLNLNLGGLDGIVTSIEGKKIVFVKNNYLEDEFWTDYSATIIDGVAYFSESTDTVTFNKRNDIYSITVLPDELGVDRIVLLYDTSVLNEQKIRVRAGQKYAGYEFYSRSDLFNVVPLITASLNTLYYQNSNQSDAVGAINVVDPVLATIDPDADIIGQNNYTSPSGIVFTNGLKVTFDASATESYQNQTYYVEGVGTSIRLVDVTKLVCAELDNTLTLQDYITINRSSLDQNAWARSNRWFHSSVIEKTAEYNKVDPIYNQLARAKRPIIEFLPDLQLYNFGTLAKLPVDKLDTVITNAYTQVQGKIVFMPGLQASLTAGSSIVVLTSGTTDGLYAGMTLVRDSGTGTFGASAVITSIVTATQFLVSVNHQTSGTIVFSAQNIDASTEYATFSVGSNQVTLNHGDRVIFSTDEDNNVRNKIYDFSIELTTEAPDVLIYRSYFVEADDYEIAAGHSAIVNAGDQGNQQWHYNGESWILSQTKTAVNQEPLFDIIDTNGISLSDSASYQGSTFTGTKIISYKRGTGANDTVLGFPLSYKNFQSQGDIEFENNFDNDTFEYLTSIATSGLININTGLLQKNITRDSSTRENIWTIVEDFSKQFQLHNFEYDGYTNLFPVSELPELSVNSPNIQVFINNQFISPENFATTKIVDRYAILVNPDLLTKGDAVFINLYNKNVVLDNAYYEIPINLDINSANKNIQTLTLGQLRNHLVTTKNKSLSVVGDIPGNSNLRDIQIINKGGSILQHSAPLIYAGLFLTNTTANFVNSIKFASEEYSRFKTKFLELAINSELDRLDVAGSVDTILSSINSLKNSMFPWYYSDMVPYSSMDNVRLPVYTVINPALKSYEITSIFESTISNAAVLVYLTRTVDNETTTVLLVKDRDYVFETERPAITFLDSFTLLYNDAIQIIEYTNTDGSYVPETPTKMGMYPKFIPEKYLDNTYTTPAYVIQGHDGSLIPAFNDFRDDFLIELERRIYNNIKAEYNPTLFDLHDYIPGKFRITDYSRQEFTQILSTGFLSWVGTHRIDYSSNNTFISSAPFTWNYRNFRDTVNGESLPGGWRSIYHYFYDTDRPHTHPWEMLGFSEKPSYWNNRYGPAPYTGGNAVLWSELSQGYIHDGDRAGFHIKYQRPNLASFIPVDDGGNLRSPEEILVADFDSNKAQGSWAVGDHGPTETAWRRSSDYVFSLHLALALAKPAKYFALLSNVGHYSRNAVTGQFEVGSTYQHITPESVLVHGYTVGDTVERTAGYINWIRDYIKNLGIDDASAYIKNYLDTISVQLAYKVGGYTDKKFLEILAEQSSPSSINDSVVIPDENYRIELFKGAPVNRLSYSAVIIEKTAAGYTVSGYNTTNPYFFIIPSQVSNNSYRIQVGNSTAVIYKDYKRQKLTIPYGFEFNSKQQVVDFLIGYQRFLVAKGFIFDEFDRDFGSKKDFVLSSREFLYWAEQGWKSNSLIIVSPVDKLLQVYDSTAVVDEILNTPDSSRVVDVSNKIVRKNNFTVSRENNLFTLKSNKEQTIAFAELSLIQYEHLLILDNETVFRDIMYAPELGNRQYRLKLVGNKTDGWNGSLELPGFLYSSPSTDVWASGKDYLKGTIVQHKSRYFSALQNILADDQFQTAYWKVIPTSELKTGMLNNFATNAQQSVLYYDIDNQIQLEETQKFSNGIIGFRLRDFFTNLGIDSTTQTKFYQGLIKQKGTINAVNALKGAKFNNINTAINVYENWAVRVGEFGALDNNNFIELPLGESAVTGNPTVIQFVESGAAAVPGIVNYTFQDLYKSSGDWTPQVFAVENNQTPPTMKQLPTAGFVHLDDVDATIFNLTDYALLTTIVGSIGNGYKVWVAKDFTNQWNVYRSSVIQGTLFALRYNIDNLVECIHSQVHGLQVDDIIVIKNFNALYDGVYKVASIIDSTRFQIALYQNLQTLIRDQAAIANGILYKFSTLKIDNPSQVESVKPSTGWLPTDKVWVDDLDGNRNWGVYNKIDPYAYQTTIKLQDSQYLGSDHFGKVISISADGFYMYASAPDSGNGRIAVFSKNTISLADVTTQWSSISPLVSGRNTNISKLGTSLANGNRFLAAGSPNAIGDKGCVYVFKDDILIQILVNYTGTAGDLFGTALTMSDDGRFLYVGSPGNETVYCYALAASRDAYITTFTGDGVHDEFTLAEPVLLADEIVVINTLTGIEYVPNVEYSIAQFTTGVNNFGYAYTIPGTIVTAGSFVPGSTYTIINTGGSTNFTSIGALNNTAGTVFEATGIGAGTGTAMLEVSLGNFYNIDATGGSGTGVTFNVTVGIAGPGVTSLLTAGQIYKIAVAGTTDWVALGAADNNPGTQFVALGTGSTQITTTGTAYYIDVTVSTAGDSYAIADTLTVPGTSFGATGANDITITVSGVGAGSNIVFVTAPTAIDKFSINQSQYHYKLIDTLVTNTAGNNFGCSLACNEDGSIIAVGANTETVDGNTRSGAVYTYHRTKQDFITNGTSSTYTAADPFNTIRRVSLDGVTLIEGTDFYIVATSVQFTSFSVPGKSRSLTIETNQFKFDQKISGLSGIDHTLGTAISMCATGCNIIASVPFYSESSYQKGAVARFVNLGRVYGIVDGTVQNPTVNPGDSIVLNNRYISFTGTSLQSVVDTINLENIPGIIASIVDDKLHITSSVVTVGQKLDIRTGTGTAFDDLGISIYKLSQTLKHPYSIGEQFGTAISLKKDAAVLGVTSDGADIYIPVLVDDGITTFDGNSTVFVTIIKESGAVYVFDLMDNPYQSAENPSLFTLTQTLTGPSIASGFNFGKSISISTDFMVVGATNDAALVTEGGSLYTYLNALAQSGWNLIRYKEPRVDVASINASFLYNSSTNIIANHFDYLDPVKGKLLGVVDQEIDYREDFDPASYNYTTTQQVINNSGFYWNSRHVGRTWWNLGEARFIDYEQGSLTYRTKNWGSLFPGSQIQIYEWVESNVLPSQYEANGNDGTPKYLDNSAYSVVSTVDPSTGIITQKYYYWVRGKTSVNTLEAKRSLSITSMESYILAPRDQGIPYIAPIAPDSFAIYNVLEFLQGDNAILHLDLAKDKSENLIHSEFQLIQEGNPGQRFPEKIIRKLRESLVGFDTLGSTVPNQNLSVQDRLGLSDKPRQSMFSNRLAAVETFVKTVNALLVQNPILLLTSPSTLYLADPVPTTGFDAQLDSPLELSYIDPDTFGDGYRVLIPNNAEYDNKWTIYQFESDTQEFTIQVIQSYQTPLYWTASNWYNESYDTGSRIDYIVGTYGDILSLSVSTGNYIKVLDNGNGQWLIYQAQADGSLQLQAAQNATIQIDSSVYDPLAGAGFDTAVFEKSGIGFDPQVGLELVNIFNSLYEEILIKDLSIQFNQVFFSMVNYIFFEQKSPDWIFKTSFIDIYHQLRNLEQIPNYVKDNQSFYEDYINEIKPYRTKIREYVPIYESIDTSPQSWTDFDLPSRYNTTTNTFNSPDVDNPADLALLQQTPYAEWYNNYTLQVADYIIGNAGVGFTVVPNVQITGGGGTGANAIATINPTTGKLTGITVIAPGDGYTSTPTVYINGVGSGAIVYPSMKNEYYATSPNLSYSLTRSITTSLKFDRTDFTSNLVTWQQYTTYANTVIAGTGSNIWVSSGNIVIYNNEAFLAQLAWDQGDRGIFDYTLFNKIDSSNVLLRATDRIETYYQPVTGMPSRRLSELIYGIDYPGVEVVGPIFTANSFEVTSNLISFNYTGANITSANTQQVNFIDLGFELDQSIKIQSFVPFDFMNNGFFKIVTVERDYMTLTSGEVPIETTYKLTANTGLTVNAGDVITQWDYSSGHAAAASAYVLQDAVNSTSIDIIHSRTGFNLTSANVIQVNGANTVSYIQSIVAGGMANVKISYLELETSVIDSNIYSTYLDTALGTRPEDINVTGGAYVDAYSSHAPEELIPGRLYDTLEMRVFTNTAANTATYGFRVFHPMNDFNQLFPNIPSGNISFTRISSNSSTSLSSNLAVSDTVIYVTDASVLEDPSPTETVPGAVFINGEKIHYYQKYDDAKIAMATMWEANTAYATGTLISNIGSNVYLVLGNVYANATSYISNSNIQLVQTNTITQLRRGVDGTGAPELHAAGSLVVSSSLDQFIPDTAVTIVKTTFNSNVTSNVSYRLTLGSNITANIGDYITQANNSSANARIIGGTVDAYRLYLSSNITTSVGNVLTQAGTLANATVVVAVDNSNEIFVTPNDGFAISGDAISISGNVTGTTIQQIVKNVIINDTIFAIEQVSGNLLVPNANVISINGVTTTANTSTISILGEVKANGNVILGSVYIQRSNLWIPYGTGAGLENSTTTAATFIKAEPSYTP